ncbi:MAG: hypothetical protein J4452_03385 [Candidatus Aenigmarchaeota archaeon]|nr:hypothetical protein [Candidatus Aenigmarchaeota archaeon]
MKMQSGGAWAVTTAFIVVGLLTQLYPSWGGLNWVIAGVVAFLVAWAMAGKK